MKATDAKKQSALFGYNDSLSYRLPTGFYEKRMTKKAKNSRFELLF